MQLQNEKTRLPGAVPQPFELYCIELLLLFVVVFLLLLLFVFVVEFGNFGGQFFNHLNLKKICLPLLFFWPSSI